MGDAVQQEQQGTALVRPRSSSPHDAAEQPTKRQKLQDEPAVSLSLEEEQASNTLAPSAFSGLPGSNLPQSSYIFANPDGQVGKLDHGDGVYHLREGDVGISGYLTQGAGEVNGIIKQR